MTDVNDSVFGSLTLYTTPEKFYLQPVNCPSEALVIDRVSHLVSLEVVNKTDFIKDATSRMVHGILGIIKLLAGPYLVVITKVTKVGEINSHAIWKVDETEMISFCKTTWHLTDKQVQYNNTYVSMVKTVLNTPHFYFSYSYDLSHIVQRLNTLGPEFKSLSLFERADPRFLWNRNLLKPLASKSELRRYCLPVIHGFVAIENVSVNNKVFKWALISRRSAQRAGTRLFCRGIDKDGNVANFVETEQIVEYDNSRSSLVQIRGSIPLFWNQLPNLRYKPEPALSHLDNHMYALEKHVESLISNYGKVVMVSLINHTGQEQILEKEYGAIMEKLNNSLVRYESFDFHKECSKMRWDRLSILINRISQEINDFGYFLSTADGKILSVQEGVIRTNCIDSLDRTNVVQGLIAKISLEDQLRKLAIIQQDEKLEHHENFINLYRNVWADNADICSIQYAGTGALKTDFTRTGKRSKSGLLKDGMNSMIRYYKNNFADGFRQDAIDLVLGNFDINEGEAKLVPCPLQEKKDWKYLALPIILLGSIAMFFLSMLITTEYSTETFMYLMFWSGMVSLTLSVIVYYGTEFVDYPKLRELKPPQ